MMIAIKKETNRYSEADLAEFKALIEKKLDRAKSELSYYHEQILDASEAVNEDHDDWSESAMAMSDLELLIDLANRQRKHIRDLEQALIRVNTKSYGICEVTGELIDKRRLLAVPTTTKSLLAKNAIKEEEENSKMPKKNQAPKASKAPQIITKEIRKKPSLPSVVLPEDDDFILEDDFNDEEDSFVSLDDIADEIGYKDNHDL